jgi:translation initiation factor 1
MEKPRGTLGDLLARQGIQVNDAAEPPPTAAPPAPPKSGAIDLSSCGKLVVRRERKGRGGKTATLIAGLGLREKQMEHLTKELKRSLGCGATLDGDTIVVGGDMTTRVAEWLRKHGAKRVVLGN